MSGCERLHCRRAENLIILVYKQIQTNLEDGSSTFPLKVHTFPTVNVYLEPSTKYENKINICINTYFWDWGQTTQVAWQKRFEETWGEKK